MGCRKPSGTPLKDFKLNRDLYLLQVTLLYHLLGPSGAMVFTPGPGDPTGCNDTQTPRIGPGAEIAVSDKTQGEHKGGKCMKRIADLNRMEVLVEVNENDIVRVQLNDSAIIEVDAFPDRKFKGAVTEIANSASTTGVSTDQVTNFEVKILISKDSYSDLIDDQTPQPLRPGMSASVDIITESKFDILSVPLQSVTLMADSLITDETRPEGSASDDPIEIVFVFNNGQVKTTQVKTGIQDNNYIEILSGLSESDEVVYAPYNVITKWLKDGTSVKVVDEDELISL